MRPPRALPLRRAAIVVGCVALGVGAPTTVSTASVPPASTSVGVPASAHAATTPRTAHASAADLKVFWRGNGHGHGLSQYGAHGAAMKGLSSTQILAFYYPGTTLTKIAPSTIRVRLSGATVNTTVFAGTKGLKVTGFGTLPTSGYTRFRLVPSGAGLRLDGDKGGTWVAMKGGLPARADFSSTAGWVQVLLGDGSSTRYRGTVGAVRSGSTELTVNRLLLDQYVEGSVPREIPASWEPAALQAQAVAARSYAESVRAYSGSSAYDICDTSSCQMYGGMAHYDSGGNLQWSEAPQAIKGNENTVLRYDKQPVFAQYSASNGGATVDGGRPYLVARSDPYDSVASGDPYLDESATVTASSVAHAVGLDTFTSITDVQRDGHGPWGGRVVSAKVVGKDYSGNTKTIGLDGTDLGYVLGTGTDFVRFDLPGAAVRPLSAPRSVKATAGDGGAMITWTPPASPGPSAIRGYRVSVGSDAQWLAPTARSVWIGPLANDRASAVLVRAVNGKGFGPAVTVDAQGAATARRVVALAPRRLFDTRTSSTLVDATHPFEVAVRGLGDIPETGTKSAQLYVTIVAPSASGVLSVGPAGVDDQPVAAIAYATGRTVTATVSVPLAPTGTIRFAPSAGSLTLLGDQQAYTTTSGGSKLLATASQDVASLAKAPTHTGALLDLDGLDGVTSSTTGVVLAIDAHGGAPGGLAVWPDGTPTPPVRQVSVSPYSSGTNTVIVPLGATHRLRLLASASGIAVRVRMIGVLGSSGGGLVTYPPSAVADGAKVRAVGTAPAVLTVGGVNQVPADGTGAVLLHMTVTAGAEAGQLWAYPAGATAPASPVAYFASGGVTTATTLLPLGKDGKIFLRSSVPGITVAVDSVGYVTNP